MKPSLAHLRRPFAAGAYAGAIWSRTRIDGRRARAFTLIEVLVSLGIFGLFAAGALSFFLQTLNAYHYDSGKLLVNRDIRTFTNEMTDNATYANYFQIYTDFATRTTTETSTDPDTGVTSTNTVAANLQDGESGDFLVLVFQDPADSAKIQRLVGYFRSADASGEGPVRRFDLTFSPSSTADIWTLFPAVSAAANQSEVIELSRGLADGRLFYNYRDRSIMVKGQIYHDGSLGRRATNTYNFTVSPRG